MFSPFDKGVGIGYFAFCKAMESFLRRNFDTMHRVAVLDLGCGPGRFRLTLDSRFEYFGCDVLQITEPEFDYRRIEGGRLPYEDSKFDLVVSNWVLEYVSKDDLPALLCEVERVLKPGGKFIFTLCNKLAWLQYGFVGPVKRYFADNSAIASIGQGYSTQSMRNLLCEVSLTPSKVSVLIGPAGMLLKTLDVHIRGVCLLLRRTCGSFLPRAVLERLPETLLRIPGRASTGGGLSPITSFFFHAAIRIDDRSGIGIEYAIEGYSSSAE